MSTRAPHPAPIQLRAAAAVLLSAFLGHVRDAKGEAAGREAEAGGEAGRELLAAVLSDDAPAGQEAQQGQQAQGQQGQGQQGQPAKRDAQLFALAAALAEYRKQHGVEQGVEQPSADDEMPQAAG